MKNFLMASCLILISTLLVFSQDLVNKNEKNETVALTEKKTEIDEVKIDIIKADKADKADKAELNKIVIEDYTTKKNKSFVPRQNSNSEYNKNEFFVGYSYQNLDSGDRSHLNGFNASYVRNITQYIGIKGDVSGAYNNDSFSFTTTFGSDTFTVDTETNTQLYNFLGGVQFKDNASTKKLKPFAHLLVGVAHQRFEITSICSGDCVLFASNRNNFSDTKLSGAFGGGLDIKINDKIDFRAIQFDYNPIFTGGQVNNNFRVGIGVVFK